VGLYFDNIDGRNDPSESYVFTHLELATEDLESLLPSLFGDKFWNSQGRKLDEASFRSGAPGRPSSMHLVRVEAERRKDDIPAYSSLASFADDLLIWLKRTHPTAPNLTRKTVENNVRPFFKAHRPKL
jgi:hypothetical protein